MTKNKRLITNCHPCITTPSERKEAEYNKRKNSLKGDSANKIYILDSDFVINVIKDRNYQGGRFLALDMYKLYSMYQQQILL